MPTSWSWLINFIILNFCPLESSHIQFPKIVQFLFIALFSGEDIHEVSILIHLQNCGVPSSRTWPWSFSEFDFFPSVSFKSIFEHLICPLPESETAKYPHRVLIYQSSVLISWPWQIVQIIIQRLGLDHLPLVLLSFEFKWIHIHIWSFDRTSSKQIHFLIVHYRCMIAHWLRPEILMEGWAVDLLPLRIGLELWLSMIELYQHAAIQTPNIAHQALGNIFASEYKDFSSIFKSTMVPSFWRISILNKKFIPVCIWNSLIKLIMYLVKRAGFVTGVGAFASLGSCSLSLHAEAGGTLVKVF